MSHALKNPYGLQNNIVRTPESVERGLACGCVCPACGEPLVANHGTEIKQPYFSHESGRSCEAAYQTALHLLAKEVLATEKKIMLPPLSVSVQLELVRDARAKIDHLQSHSLVP